jgi:hypothetical protein
MELIQLAFDQYKEWDDFCLESDEAWFNHTTAWIEYTLAMRIGNESLHTSFMVYENRSLLAICPLIIEKNKYNKIQTTEFSYSGFLTPAPALKNDVIKKKRKKIIDLIFNKIDEIALQYNVVRSLFMIYPLSHNFLRTEQHSHNILQSYGYNDISISSQIIDLTLDLDLIRSGFRKGHKYDINRGLKPYNFEIWDSKHITPEVFELYRLMHRKAAGRVTRPEKTFDLMYRWIESGDSILVSAQYDAKYLGFSIINIYKNCAYYQSSCNDPDFKGIPIAHAMQWRIIEYLKSNRINYYELGWQFSKGLSFESGTAKELDISKYKRGFGGFTVPLFRGEKFYSSQYFQNVISDRVLNYKNNILENVSD